MLFGAFAHAGYRAPLAQAAQASCGSICLAMPGFYVIAAAAWGGTAIVAAMAYARFLQALRPYPQHESYLAHFGWAILGIAVSAFDALVGAHSYGRTELDVGWYVGGYGVNPPITFGRGRDLEPDDVAEHKVVAGDGGIAMIPHDVTSVAVIHWLPHPTQRHVCMSRPALE